MSRSYAPLQADIIQFLSSPAAYGFGHASVDRVDTHISVVFLAGSRAYKLKRAVRFDYVDFSTLERRRAACDAEVRLNRRTAPDLYLGICPVTQEADGSFAIGGRGEPVDWLVEMRRFDQETLFDRLAEAGRLDMALLDTLAAQIARFHGAAAPRIDRGGAPGIRWVIDGNAASFASESEHLFDQSACDRLAADLRVALARAELLLEDRRSRGLVKACHGDLHLRNICLLDGLPTLFDAVEFNDDISCVDVLYDFSFLLMDLWRRGLRVHANAVFNAYLWRTHDLEGLALLPLFLSCRASVRAKTSASAARVQSDPARIAELRAAAREYLQLAQTFLRPPPAVMVAIGGFSGSGKSTLARALAASVGAAPGALILRSDVIRKELSGVSPLTPLANGDYTASNDERVYRVLTERAGQAVRTGQAVITDAVFAESLDRARIEAAARSAGVPFKGLWLSGQGDVLAARLVARGRDASDADVNVLERQLRAGAGTVEWSQLDTTESLERVQSAAQEALAP